MSGDHQPLPHEDEPEATGGPVPPSESVPNEAEGGAGADQPRDDSPAEPADDGVIERRSEPAPVVASAPSSDLPSASRRGLSSGVVLVLMLAVAGTAYWLGRAETTPFPNLTIPAPTGDATTNSATKPAPLPKVLDRGLAAADARSPIPPQPAPNPPAAEPAMPAPSPSPTQSPEPMPGGAEKLPGSSPSRPATPPTIPADAPPKLPAKPALPVVATFTPAAAWTNAPPKIDLLRMEILRQALLIAVRERGWADVQDGRLLSVPLPDAVSKVPAATLVVDVDQTTDSGMPLRLQVRRQGEKSGAALPADLPALSQGQVPDYLSDAQVALKKLAGSELTELDALGLAVADAQRLPWSAKTKLPADAVDRIDDLSLIEQYQALRLLHQHEQAEGWSPALLSALARVYAQMGVSTFHHWNQAYQVYFARALVYALHLQQRDFDHPLSRWTVAYVLALMGRERDALAALPADRKGGPSWGPMLVAYAERDLAAFRTLEAPAGMDDMYHFLMFRLRYEHGYDAVDDGFKLVAGCPEFFQGYDELSRMNEISVLHRSSAAPLAALFDLVDGLPERLVGHPEPLVEDLRRALAKAETSLDGLTAVLAVLDRPTTEPHAGAIGPAVLATLLRETAVVHFGHRYWLTRGFLGVSAAGLANEFTPILKTHRLGMVHTRSPGDVSAQPPDFVDASRHAAPYTTTSNYLQLRNFRAPDGKIEILSHHVLRILATQTPGESPLLNALSRAEAIPCLNSPLNGARQAKGATEPWLLTLEEEYPTAPRVLIEIADRYRNLQRPVEAVRVTRKLLELAPTLAGFRLLGRLADDYGEAEDWKKAMDAAFARAPEHGLTMSRLRVEVADYLLAQGRVQEAIPYADAAAQSWAQWAMECALRTHHAAGNYGQATVWAQRIAERYGDGERPMAYGGLYEPQFQAMIREQFLRRRDQVPDDPKVARVAALSFALVEEYQHAEQIMEDVWQQTQIPIDGLFAVALGLERKAKEGFEKRVDDLAAQFSKDLKPDSRDFYALRLALRIKQHRSGGRPLTYDDVSFCGEEDRRGIFLYIGSKVIEHYGDAGRMAAVGNTRAIHWLSVDKSVGLRTLNRLQKEAADAADTTTAPPIFLTRSTRYDQLQATDADRSGGARPIVIHHVIPHPSDVGDLIVADEGIYHHRHKGRAAAEASIVASSLRMIRAGISPQRYWLMLESRGENQSTLQILGVFGQRSATRGANQNQSQATQLMHAATWGWHLPGAGEQCLYAVPSTEECAVVSLPNGTVTPADWSAIARQSVWSSRFAFSRGDKPPLYLLVTSPEDAADRSELPGFVIDSETAAVTKVAIPGASVSLVNTPSWIDTAHGLWWLDDRDGSLYRITDPLKPAERVGDGPKVRAVIIPSGKQNYLVGDVLGTLDRTTGKITVTDPHPPFAVYRRHEEPHGGPAPLVQINNSRLFGLEAVTSRAGRLERYDIRLPLEE